jgi:hypothetical protein
MTGLTVRVEVGVGRGGDAFDMEEIDTLSRRLRQELLELDVGQVVIPSVGRAPDGAKGSGACIVGALQVMVSDPALLRALVETVMAWAGMSRNRAARLEIDGDVLDVSGISAHDQAKLIDLFIARHSASN